jgi:hypothetical protein
MKVDREVARTYTFTRVDGQRPTAHGVLSSRGMFIVDSCRPTSTSSTLPSIRSKRVDLH